MVYRTGSDRGISIIEYLNSYPLIFYYFDFSLLYNNNHYLDAPRDRQLFLNENLDDSTQWSENGVDIENECTGDSSIHHFLSRQIGDKRLPFSYYDHGSGEIADFITAEMDINEILIKLYHCKGSGSRNPGNRVNDIYEVLGQGIKSLNYTNYTRLIQKLERRQRGKTLIGPCSDSVELLKNFIANNRGVKVGFQIILVQPGITKVGIEDRISHLLSAANSAIRNTNNCRNLLVLTSI